MYKYFIMLLTFVIYPCIAMQFQDISLEIKMGKLLSKDIDSLLYPTKLIALPIGEYSKSAKNVVVISKISQLHTPTGLIVVKKMLRRSTISRNHMEFYMEYRLSDGTVTKESHTDIITIPQNSYSIAIQLESAEVKDYSSSIIYSGKEFDDFLQSLIDQSQD